MKALPSTASVISSARACRILRSKTVAVSPFQAFRSADAFSIWTFSAIVFSGCASASLASYWTGLPLLLGSRRELTYNELQVLHPNVRRYLASREARTDLIPAQWFGIQISLTLVTTFLDQHYGLFGGFNAFCSDCRLETLAKADDGANDGKAVAGPRQPGNERAINLYLVECEAAQVGEARVPGPEVIESDADAQILELPQDVEVFLAIT